MVQQILGAVFAVVVALTACFAYFWGTNWLLDRFFATNPAVYSSDALRKNGEILLNATTFRFDGSDLMPGPIGAGAFWTGMVDFANGKSSKDVADQIQAAWDKL